MPVTGIARWEEFVEKLKTTPPEDQTVQLTFGIRYSEQGIPYITLITGYADGDSYCELAEYLAFARLGRDRSSSVAMQARLDGRKKELEAMGFVVAPGRYQKIDRVSE